MRFQNVIWPLFVLVWSTILEPFSWAVLDKLVENVLERRAATGGYFTNSNEGSLVFSSALRQVIDDQFFCGIYVQFDDALERSLTTIYGYRMAKPILGRIVIRMIQAATMVFQRSGSRYLSQINFYLKKLRPRAVPKIGLNDFLDNPHIPNAKNYCILVHLTNDDPHGFVGFGKLSGVCHGQIEQTHAMSMVIRHPDQQWQLDLTFVHEIGHLFGAEHDGIPGLIPGDIRCPLSENEPANYIMHPRSRYSYHENQRKFSTCSIRSIQHHLAIVFQSGAYKRCMDSFSYETCGIKLNKGPCAPEEISPEFTVDNCWPLSYATPPKEWPQCTVTDGACCNLTSCKFARHGTVCQAETKCHRAATCNGISAVCPEPRWKLNGTRCGDASCMGGLCVGSLCVSFGFQPCFPTSSVIGEMCHPYCYGTPTTLLSVSSNNCVPLCELDKSVPCTTIMTPETLHSIYGPDDPHSA
ncbi:disintegrin and metalloproteinase domain-containing protein 10-like isoform X2 [Varroa destructor]|uniref:Peptidase M12B domain-containing protein n=1 Tax=Varroa destructor TaxID=109461 RepID=A0A7M7JAC9_VARDE|nr:disintegrin and metalloproteinase domain-containing protein 10-like isoform X2 [Varroa destructor]